MRLERDENTQVHAVDKVIDHPKCKVNIIIHDVAVIKLTKSIKIDHVNTEIIPLALSRPDEGAACVSMGWGMIYNVNVS